MRRSAQCPATGTPAWSSRSRSPHELASSLGCLRRVTHGGRTMRELNYRLGVVALLTAAFLVPLASASGQQTPQRGGVLRIAHVGDPPSLDTHMTGGAVPTHILNNVYEGLFAMDSKFQPRPMLAERLDLSPNPPYPNNTLLN